VFGSTPFAVGYLLLALVLVWRGSAMERRPAPSLLKAFAGWCAVLIGAAALAASPVLLAV
jgi:hypothetical protein